MKFTPGNAQHIGSRNAQQDAFAFSDLTDLPFVRHGGSLGLVADGIGGLEHGDSASRIAVATFQAAYRAKLPEETIPAALERAALAANTAVYEFGKQAGRAGDVGTTLVAAVAHGNALYWLAIGDSSLLLLRDGELTILTQEHTYETELMDHVRTGELSAEDARRHPEREALTSYVGTPRLIYVDRTVRPFPLESGDRVILASDGLTKTLSLDEIAAEQSTKPEDFCDRLVRKVLEKGRTSQDNVTVIAFNVLSPEQAATAEARTVTLAPRRKKRKLAWGALLAGLAAAAFFAWRQWMWG